MVMSFAPMTEEGRSAVFGLIRLRHGDVGVEMPLTVEQFSANKILKALKKVEVFESARLTASQDPSEKEQEQLLNYERVCSLLSWSFETSLFASFRTFLPVGFLAILLFLTLHPALEAQL